MATAKKGQGVKWGPTSTQNPYPNSSRASGSGTRARPQTSQARIGSTTTAGAMGQWSTSEANAATTDDPELEYVPLAAMAVLIKAHMGIDDAVPLAKAINEVTRIRSRQHG